MFFFFTHFRKEPIQRQYINDQLKQARSIRASLEEAASKVEALSSSSSSNSNRISLHKQAMNILHNSLPDIQQLEKLTSALEGGGYTTANIGDNARRERKVKLREEQMELERQREREIIRKHLREFARESNCTAEIGSEGDNDDSLDGNFTVKAASELTIQEEEVVEIFPSSSRNATALPAATATKVKPVKRKLSNSPEGQTAKRGKADLKRSKSNGSTREGTGSGKVKEKKKRKKKKKQSEKQPLPTKDPPDIISSAVKPSSTTSAIIKTGKKEAPSTSAVALKKKSKPLKPRTTKKCHDCKKPTNRHRVCNFWKLSGFTGSKCGKVFCMDCLTSKYSVGEDVCSSSNPSGRSIEEIVANAALDSEWHCPSCLSVCQCVVCVSQRKRDAEREYGERKSQRRATAHSSYSNFF